MWGATSEVAKTSKPLEFLNISAPTTTTGAAPAPVSAAVSAAGAGANTGAAGAAPTTPVAPATPDAPPAAPAAAAGLLLFFLSFFLSFLFSFLFSFFFYYFLSLFLSHLSHLLPSLLSISKAAHTDAKPAAPVDLVAAVIRKAATATKGIVAAVNHPGKDIGNNFHWLQVYIFFETLFILFYSILILRIIFINSILEVIILLLELIFIFYITLYSRS